jgi:hypothetical protein
MVFRAERLVLVRGVLRVDGALTRRQVGKVGSDDGVLVRVRQSDTAVSGTSGSDTCVLAG